MSAPQRQQRLSDAKQVEAKAARIKVIPRTRLIVQTDSTTMCCYKYYTRVLFCVYWTKSIKQT